MPYNQYPQITKQDIAAADQYRETLASKMRRIWDNQQRNLPKTLQRSCEMEARNFVNKMKNDKKFCDAVINNRNIATTEFARMATLGLSCAPGLNEIYLSYFGGKPSFIIGVDGFVKLATELYKCSNITTGLLYKGQTYSAPHGKPLEIDAVKQVAGDETTELPVGSWAQCLAPDGKTWLHVVLTADDIARIQKQAMTLWRKTGNFADHSRLFQSNPKVWYRKTPLRHLFTQVIRRHGAHLSQDADATVARVIDADSMEHHRPTEPLTEAQIQDIVAETRKQYPDAEVFDLTTYISTQHNLTPTQTQRVRQLCIEQAPQLATLAETKEEPIDAEATEDTEDNQEQEPNPIKQSLEEDYDAHGRPMPKKTDPKPSTKEGTDLLPEDNEEVGF